VFEGWRISIESFGWMFDFIMVIVNIIFTWGVEIADVNRNVVCVICGL
jgi:hypothetical protein